MKYVDMVEKKLEMAHEQYIAEVERIAEEVRREKLIPYLTKRDFNFLPGMGTYRIFTKDEKPQEWTENLPASLAEVLGVMVPGSPCCLAEFMAEHP